MLACRAAEEGAIGYVLQIEERTYISFLLQGLLSLVLCSLLSPRSSRFLSSCASAIVFACHPDGGEEQQNGGG